VHLARRLLREGWRVDLVDNFSRAALDPDLAELLRDERATLHEGDLRDRSFVGGLGRTYSEIFHFAAILGVQNVLHRPFEVLEANAALTLAAIELARRQPLLRRFLFASTSEVYAGTLEHFGLPFPTAETTALALPGLDRPRSSYMLSKIYGEALCHHAGVPFTIVRPHNVYGPRMGMAHVIPELLQRAFAALENDPFEVYSVRHARTFCYVDDAVEMILRLAMSGGAAGKAVNVGSESPELAIGKLAEIVLAAVGKRLAIKPMPETDGSPVRRAPDMSLCTEITGYRSTIPTEVGVAKTYAWYREHVFAASSNLRGDSGARRSGSSR
jgi:nucleoside-diphosphate-sugar epimerase